MATTTQGQYGGQLTPQVTSAGGAALASNLGSAALGMLTGGGSVALDAAMKAAGDSSTTVQTPTLTIGPQSTGSKVFNLQSGADAMQYNDFWSNVTGTKSGGNTMLYVAMAIGAVLLFFIIRRK